MFMIMKSNESLTDYIAGRLKNSASSVETQKKFREYLVKNEMSPGTVEEYSRNVTLFYKWVSSTNEKSCILNKRELEKKALEYKKALQDDNLAATTINAKLAALNKYMDFKGMKFKVKYLRVQNKVFKDTNKELEKKEYEQLIETARTSGKERMVLVLETLGSTGIRVSELKYITVEALKEQAIEISMKGKIRTIVIPEKMKEKLRKYVSRKNIQSGEIFITSSGKSLSRNQIWKEMKDLSSKAQIASTKVFPHNIRALFARLYYEESKDVVRLGDILGHSSINTTRIYLKVSINEYQKQMERMNFVV